MTDMFETRTPLPPSPLASPPTSSIPIKRAPDYIRTSFSSGYVGPKSSQGMLFEASPLVTSPTTPSLRRHSQSRGHRHTKSLNAQATPPPLPLPIERADSGYTSNKETSDAENIIRGWRLKRSETDPRSLSKHADEATSLLVLPDNPKLWTPAQLAQYLLTALRFRGSKSSETILVPKPVAQDIANFVVKYKLNGRAFLRLEEKDMEDMGINQLWRTVLLSSSLELRKSVLKGRIWGFGPDGNNTHDHPSEQERRVPSTVLEREEATMRRSSSASYIQLALSNPCDPSTLRSSGYLSQNSSTLSFDSDVPDYPPSYRSTRPRAQSASSNASSSVGRVREIVKTLERAASSSEDVTQGNYDAGFASTEMTSESEEDLEPDVVGNITINAHGPKDRPANKDVPFRDIGSPESNRISDACPSAARSSKASPTITSETMEIPPVPPAVNILAASQSSYPVPSNSPAQDISKSKGIADDEPTIEALLEGEGEPCEARPLATSWGAEAWEGEFPGGTSRRAPVGSAPIIAQDERHVANSARGQDQTVRIPRTAWVDLCRRLDETERRLAFLEMQKVERKSEVENPEENPPDDRDAHKPSLPGGLSVAALPPYLVIISVGVCVLVAHYVFGRVVGRRPRL